MAPSDYQGPKHGRVIMFEGARADGRAARRCVFAEGIIEGLNLAFGPDGTLYVIASKTVVALADRDGDDRAEEARMIRRGGDA